MDSNKLNILVVIVNYGDEQIDYLKQVINEFKSFKKYNVHIIVNSNIDLTIEGIDEINIIKLENYEFLPITCRKVIWDNSDNYDLFIYTENDHLFKEHHIDKFLEYNSILPENRIAGLIQYEENEMGRYYPAFHANFKWDDESVEEYDGKKFAHFTNVHQASFIITKKQLLLIGKSFNSFFGMSMYGLKCRVNTDIYNFKKWKKMICISEFEDNLIRHLPNLYINGDKGRGKLRSDEKRMMSEIKKLLN